MSKIAYRQGFTGAGSELSAIPAAQISDGDSAMVVDSSKFYFYRYDASSTAATSAPSYVRPNDYGTAGVWIMAESPYDVGMGSLPTGVIMEGSIIQLDTYSDSSANKFYAKPGKIKDSTNAVVGSLSTLMGKLVNTTWSAGDGGGILLNGSIAAGKMAHVYALIKDSDASVDIGALLYTDVITSYLPSGYSKYRYLDSYYTTASGSGNDISEFATVGGQHRNFIIADSIGQNLSSATSYTLVDCSSRLPSSDYVDEVLFGGNAGSSTDHHLYFAPNSSVSYLDFEVYAMSDSYTTWNHPSYNNIMVPNASWYVKQSGSYNASMLIHQFKIRR